MGDEGKERIDRALDRLDEALGAAGFNRLARAACPNAVAELERELVPYSLPRELRRLWERVDFASLRVLGSYLWEPHGPETAGELYRMNRDEPGLFGPPLLLPIAGSSGQQCSVELGSGSSAGGTVVSVELSLRIEYASIGDLVEVYGELIEEGRFTRSPSGHGWLDGEEERERQRQRFRDARLAETYGDRNELDLDPRGWPDHWLEAAGIRPEGRSPRGATHTIAELVKASAAAPLTARIAGKVERIVGIGRDTLATVADGTGAIDVWCPAGTSLSSPRQGERFELEVSVEKPIPPPVDIETWQSAA